jgi:hypothetical protein
MSPLYSLYTVANESTGHSSRAQILKVFGVAIDWLADTRHPD